MSETEIFYKAIADKFGVQRKWGDLHPIEQHHFFCAGSEHDSRSCA